MTSNPVVNELLRDAQRGSPAAIEMLITKYTHLLEIECSRFGIQQHPDWSHSDLFQEVVFRVWTKLDQFDGVGANDDIRVMFEHWLRVTARSVLHNLHRYRNANKRMPRKTSQPIEDVAHALVNQQNRERSPSSVLEVSDEKERLRQVIDECLDLQSRKILQLRVVDGLSFQEISEQLSLTYEQVRYRFQNSLAELEKLLS